MGKYTEKLENMRKTAGVTADVLATAKDLLLNHALPAYKYLVDKAYITGPLLGLGGAYALAKGTKPTHITNNADKELYLNTLKTEVAAARRKLSDLENINKMKGSNARVFDKFLG